MKSMRTSMKKKAPKQVWTEDHCRTMTQLSFNHWMIEQISGDTMFHAECFLQDIRKKTKTPLFKNCIEHMCQALDVVAYGPGFGTDFFELSKSEQKLICATAKMMATLLTDAPIEAPQHTAAV